MLNVINIMATILTITNHKGGVCKTTTAISIASALAKRYYKTLLIDLDPQANLTSFFKLQEKDSIYKSLINDAVKLPYYEVKNNLFVAPASENLTALEMVLDEQIADREEENRILKKKLRNIKKDFDYIIIDCPPSKSILTYNALFTTDKVIIPMTAEAVPYEGFTSIIALLQTIKQNYNNNLSLLGILITRYNRRKINKVIEDYMRKNYGNYVFQTVIRENVDLMEAPLYHKDIFEYNPDSNGAKDYDTLTNEIILKLK